MWMGKRSSTSHFIAKSSQVTEYILHLNHNLNNLFQKNKHKTSGYNITLWSAIKDRLSGTVFIMVVIYHL